VNDAAPDAEGSACSAEHAIRPSLPGLERRPAISAQGSLGHRAMFRVGTNIALAADL
jgi:hypothetical protein